jgi:hypothetical protein
VDSPELRDLLEQVVYAVTHAGQSRAGLRRDTRSLYLALHVDSGSPWEAHS